MIAEANRLIEFIPILKGEKFRETASLGGKFPPENY